MRMVWWFVELNRVVCRLVFRRIFLCAHDGVVLRIHISRLHRSSSSFFNFHSSFHVLTGCLVDTMLSYFHCNT